MIEQLNNLFKQLKLKFSIIGVQQENNFLVFDLRLQSGGTYKKLEKHLTEIALTLRSLSNPLIYPITQEGIVRMEVMMAEQDRVLFNSIEQDTNYKIPLILGKCRRGNSIIADLAEMPHLLVSGTTGSGKSMILHSIINSAFLNNNMVALIDPKRVEFSCYDSDRRLHCPIAKTTNEALELITNLIQTMEERFKILEKHKCVNIFEYGEMSPIVLVIDELADLMLADKKQTQELICRLAQKSRACGIHIVVATQRPSVDIITGSIKANFPARICCKVSSATDSRIVLDRNGAENLVGKGDALINCIEYNFQRFKGAFLSKEDISNLADKNNSLWSRIWFS